MATTTPKTAEAAPAPATAPVTPMGPRSYLAMMLLAVFLLPTGLARAYRGEQIGWTRFWIFVGVYGGSILLFWVPLLNVLVALALLALCVWGAIDVFQLYKTKTDSEGKALVSSPRDEKFGKAFFIVFLVSLVLTGVGILLALIFGAILVSFFMNGTNNFNSDNSNYFDSSQYLRDLEDRY